MLKCCAANVDVDLSVDSPEGIVRKVCDLIKTNQVDKFTRLLKSSRKLLRPLINTVDENSWSLLHYTTYCNNAYMLRFLLDTFRGNININAVDNENVTPLNIAAKNANVQCVLLLLDNHADPFIANINGVNPLHSVLHGASNAPHPDILTVAAALVGMYPELALCKTTSGTTPMHIAAATNLVPAISLLLQVMSVVFERQRRAQRARHNITGAEAITPGQVPAFGREPSKIDTHSPSSGIQDGPAGSVRMAPNRVVVAGEYENSASADSNASPNLSTNYDRSNVYFNSEFYSNGAHSHMIKIRSKDFFPGRRPKLSQTAAKLMTESLSYQNDKGYNAFHLAAEHSNGESLRAMLLYATLESLQMKTAKGMTVLHRAIAKGADQNFMQIVEFCSNFINTSTLLNTPTGRGERSAYPLHLAVRTQSVSLVAKIIEITNAGNIDCQDTSCWTPLHYAVAGNNISIAKLLVDARAAIDAEDDEHLTPLMKACEMGLHEMAEFLLLSGASPHRKFKGGFTAIHFAAQNGHLKICQLLHRYGASASELSDEGWLPLKVAKRFKREDVISWLQTVQKA